MIPDEQPAIEDVFCVAGTDLVNVLPPLFFSVAQKKGNQREGRIETHTAEQEEVGLDGDFPRPLRQGDYAGVGSGGSAAV